MCTPELSKARTFASSVCMPVRRTWKHSPQCVVNVAIVFFEYRYEISQMFCREAVMWKYLQHQNVLPLRGVTISPPQLISDLVLHGDLSEYIGDYPNADRVTLVGVQLVAPAVVVLG